MKQKTKIHEKKSHSLFFLCILDYLEHILNVSLTKKKPLLVKIHRLALEEKPVSRWKIEEISEKLEELGGKVRQIHGRVCKCLLNKYNSVLSIDDKTQGLSQEVIDQFTHIRPVFEHLEKVIDIP